MTKFLILAMFATADDKGPGQWKEVATIEASSKDAALRSIGGNAGTYVAVPKRSWAPVRLEVERVERVRLSAATTSPADTQGTEKEEQA